MSTTTLRTLLTLTCWSALSLTLNAEDWTQFRGPGGLGISSDKNVPVKWSKTENVRWRVALPAPGNNGSPIVSKDRVFVVVAENQGKKRSLQCHDRDTGKLLWTQSVDVKKKMPTHGTNPYGGTTPAADGERVVVWHSTGGMQCYDYSGKELWSKDLGEFEHIWGYGASPIIYNDMVLCNCGPGPRTFLIALNVKTGEEIWRTEEPGGVSGLPDAGGKRGKWIGSWSTPIVTKVDGQDQIIVSYPHHVKAYNPKDGKVIWHCEGLSDLVYTSPLIGDEVCVAMCGFRGQTVALKMGGKGDVTKANTLWTWKRPQPQRIGSGVILGKHGFIANQDRSAWCFDVKTGKKLWEAPMKTRGRQWASLVAAGDRLYVTNQSGQTAVFANNPEKYELLSINDVGEKSNSTLAISNGQIFLRTYDALYCIEEKK